MTIKDQSQTALADRAGDESRSRGKEIGAFFRRRRLETGLSVETVTQELGLPSEDLLLKYENGVESFPLDEIFALTNLLNIPPHDVLVLIDKVYAQK